VHEWLKALRQNRRDEKHDWEAVSKNRFQLLKWRGIPGGVGHIE
jgi:hypothetical protein